MPDERIVELRIHGVSGGQAEELLDVEPAMRVSGDGLAGFFRWRHKRDTETVHGVRREIFAWGNLTSGRSSRALWLLLLPFMLVNIAYWMRPGRLDGPRSRVHVAAGAVYGLSVRLLALSLTALLVLAAAGVGMDLVGWQCSGWGDRCAAHRPLLGPLSASGSPFSLPGPALAIGSLLPLAVTAVLWRLSRRTSGVYEVANAPHAPLPHDTAPLSDPGFWRNSKTMGRLRSAHIAVALIVVAALLVMPPLTYDSAAGAAGVRTAGAVLAGLLAVALALSTASVLVPGTDAGWNRRADFACAALRNASLVLLGCALAYVLLPRPDWAAAGRLPGYASVLNSLFAAQCVLAVTLAIAALVLFRRNPAHDDAALDGMAGPVTAVFGALLGGVFSAAIVYQTAGLLGGCYYPGAEAAGCLPLRPPSAYAWLQAAFTMEAVIATAIGAVLLVILGRRTESELDTVAATYARPRDAQRTREIAHGRALGGLTEILPACLAALLIPVVALVSLVLYAVWSGRLTAGPAGYQPLPPVAAEAAGDPAQEAVTAMVTTGSFLGGVFLIALVLLGSSAYRNRPTRQGVGVLWDIGTFWPRVAHPLSPPSYAERAVPQLVARVSAMTDDGDAVVLSGHSQGSVLAAATVWQLPTRCRGTVALITHGSPLYRLYARYFPAYFGPGALADIRDRVSGWRNLWRATDAIGGPIRADGATVGFAEPLPDPRSYDVRKGEALAPEVLGHSFYTHDPAYVSAVEAAVARLRTAMGTGADLHPGLEVQVTVVDDAAITAVEEAVTALLHAFGWRTATRLAAEHGPWFRRSRVTTAGPATRTEVEARLGELARALRARPLVPPRADRDPERAEAASVLLAALEAAGEALVRVGPLLVVRTGGRLTVHTMEPAEEEHFDRHPLLLRDPGATLEQLGEVAGVPLPRPGGAPPTRAQGYQGP
ncbi:hypothetical protein ACFO4E_12705 [Nocardiopsis mangrovi]|uniref:Integral membrane protein n=1 Tax=Nocardiopsis mangrovi TaxID=1179818 RepID=A0ABV9DWL9_9ACTN